jgi:signal transduction histidine kinase
MTGQSGAAGEIALRLAEIAVSAGSARERDAAIMRLLRERLRATFVACYKGRMRAGKAPEMRLRASDAGVTNVHSILTQAARDAARTWLATETAAPCVLDDSRFGGWQVTGCLPGGGLAVVALCPPDRDSTGAAETLTALAPMLSLALGRGVGHSRAQSNSGATADSAKAGFVSLVSHALRTPLNTLTGFIEILLDQPFGPLNERQREFLGYARESGWALTQLVEDVTLLSRADEGSLALRYEPLDAAVIAGHALRVVEAAAGAKGVQINLHVENEALTLEGDGERLAHALAKLLENAVKFSPEGSVVTVMVMEHGGAVKFAVRDEGIGVAPEDSERIFTRFYQAERTAKDHPGGYGLGLAVARMIAQAHNGEILVKIAPERGATFVLMVPIGATANADQRTATKSSRGASGDVSRSS